MSRILVCTAWGLKLNGEDRTGQELIALVRASFEYLSWFVDEGSHELEKWKARARQAALVAEKAAILN